MGIHPDHSHLRHALGVQLYKKGSTDAARKELRRAAIKGHDEALLSIARLEEEAGRVEEARTAYKRACGLIKRSPGTHEMAPDGVTAAIRGSRGPVSRRIVGMSRPRRRCVAGRRSGFLATRTCMRSGRGWKWTKIERGRSSSPVWSGVLTPSPLHRALLDGVEYSQDMISARVSKGV